MCDPCYVELAPVEAPAWQLRLFSRGSTDAETPVDEVPARQEAFHTLLIRWGAWARARVGGGGGGGSGLLSVESLYRKVADQTAGITGAPPSPDPALIDVERVMLRLPVEVMHIRWERRRQVTREVHGLTLRLAYVERWAPQTICAALVPRLRPRAWAAHVTAWRAMAQNGLRALRI